MPIAIRSFATASAKSQSPRFDGQILADESVRLIRRGGIRRDLWGFCGTPCGKIPNCPEALFLDRCRGGLGGTLAMEYNFGERAALRLNRLAAAGDLLASLRLEHRL